MVKPPPGTGANGRTNEGRWVRAPEPPAFPMLPPLVVDDRRDWNRVGLAYETAEVATATDTRSYLLGTGMLLHLLEVELTANLRLAGGHVGTR